MMRHAERIERLLKDRQKRNIRAGAVTFVVAIIAILIITLQEYRPMFSLPIVLINNVPLLYTGWYRRKLLLTFNEDAQYKKYVHLEFDVMVAYSLLFSLSILFIMLGWIPFIAFVLIAIGLMIFLFVAPIWIDRKLTDIDPEHAKRSDLYKASLTV